jgi:hypothetical protein
VYAFTHAEDEQKKNGFSGEFNYECTNEEKSWRTVFPIGTGAEKRGIKFYLLKTFLNKS